MLHKGSHCRNADDHTLLAVELLRARVNMQKNLLWGSRHLIEAALIYERDEADRWLLEAHLLLPRLLCGVPRKLGISACTMKYYARFFFDVRRALKSRGWINGNALGPPPHYGYADHELSPIWKRMAYQYGERMLDICLAVTTGRGREKYTLDELDTVEFLVEELRLSLVRFPKRIIQLQLRHEADFTGAHPSTYHMGRERRQVMASTPSPSAEELDRSLVPRVVDPMGDRASL